MKDSLSAWGERYQALAVVGVRSEAVALKVAMHLGRFVRFFEEAYGHDRISACLPRDVAAWRAQLVANGLAPATVNNHLASLSGFTTWVSAQAPDLFAAGNPTHRLGELALPPLEPQALTEAQVRSLKNLCDRLERFHLHRGRRHRREGVLHAYARPVRDRAMVYVLLSTGLRRSELVALDLNQLSPTDPDRLRRARMVRLKGVRGKGGTQRTVFLSADARRALADYLEVERPRDAGLETTALFLSAAGLYARAGNGRLSVRAINRVLSNIGRWHDAETDDEERRIGSLRPHLLRHTFAFQLSTVTGADAYELERRLGHRSQRYIQRYTNPPESVAARYVEDM